MGKMGSLSCLLLVAFLVAGGVRAHDYPEIGVYELRSESFTVQFTNYGATMLSLVLPDKTGKWDDIVLGFDSLESYKNDTTYFGAIVGRVANRIGGAKFTINGRVYKLVANDGNNTLHGGSRGFSKVVWGVSSYDTESHVTFTYHSFDGEEGFPGNLSVYVTYMIIGSNKLGIKLEARALDKPTPVNLALHTYWNLAGQSSGNILSHQIQLFGSKITPVDKALIPTGEIRDIRGSPYDFLAPHAIGSQINEVPGGYDINYVLDDTGTKHLKKVALVQEKHTGRKLELWSNQPGVQFYTSNVLDHVVGKGGFIYTKYAGLCLETQGFPDSVNHPNFPSQIVNPGQHYVNVMVFRFTTY